MNAVLALDHALCERHPQRHPRSPKRFKHPRGAGSGGQHLKGPAVVPPMLCPILPLSQRSRSVALHIPVAAGSRSLVAKGSENMRTQRMLARLLEGKKAPAAGAWGLVGTI